MPGRRQQGAPVACAGRLSSTLLLIGANERILAREPDLVRIDWTDLVILPFLDRGGSFADAVRGGGALEYTVQRRLAKCGVDRHHPGTVTA